MQWQIQILVLERWQNCRIQGMQRCSESSSECVYAAVIISSSGIAEERKRMSIILEAEHLTKVFTTKGKEVVKAVDDVSFQLKAGEILGIVGESGCGKSTLAKLITRLTDLTSGTLIFDGKDITNLTGRERKDFYGKIQMVFQNL